MEMHKEYRYKYAAYLLKLEVNLRGNNFCSNFSMGVYEIFFMWENIFWSINK